VLKQSINHGRETQTGGILDLSLIAGILLADAISNYGEVTICEICVEIYFFKYSYETKDKNFSALKKMLEIIHEIWNFIS
jgi:hypothetical protein